MIYDLLCLDNLSRIISIQNFSLNTVQLVLPQHTTCLVSTLLAALSRRAQDWGNKFRAQWLSFKSLYTSEVSGLSEQIYPFVNRNHQQYSQYLVVQSGIVKFFPGQGTKLDFRQWKIKENQNIKIELALKQFDAFKHMTCEYNKNNHIQFFTHLAPIIHPYPFLD